MRRRILNDKRQTIAMSQVSRIQILPDLLIRKIAAGEVVERPASVVKELVENAIDAGATRVALTIEDGGKQLIRVTDDGCGMSPDELRLAVVQHATSKITVAEDLYHIGTMGFRGEALASISAVCKLRIVSRTPNAVEAHALEVVADAVESSRSTGAPPGTTVEVRDLFFNVPARRKFLCGAPTEVAHINEQLIRIALPNPQIGFELTNNGRVTQHLPRCEARRQRIEKYYGAELSEALMHVDREERGIRIEAFLAPPAQSRATAQWQYAFVNGRFIRDKSLLHAMKEAYRGLTEPNRNAVVFLFIDLDPSDVDVNVHPTKIEVRWSDRNLIHSQVLSALRETLLRHDLTPRLHTGGASQPINPQAQSRVREEMAAWLKTQRPLGPNDAPVLGGGSDHPVARPEPHARFQGKPMAHGDPMAHGNAMEAWQALYGRTDGPAAPNAGSGSDDAPRTDRGIEPASTSDRFDVGAADLGRARAIQMHNLYLVIETDEGILIVDQHALHERVMYEVFKERIASGKLESQRLLLPESVTVTPDELARLDEHGDLLDKLGIEVTPFGHDAVGIQSFPTILKDTDVAKFMRDLLDKLATRSGATGTDVVLDDMLSMMACKAAVKAGDSLTQDEIDALMKQRHLIEKSTSCPHGRPTMLSLSKADLNRQFHRT